MKVGETREVKEGRTYEKRWGTTYCSDLKENALSWESWLIRPPDTREIPSSSLGESTPRTFPNFLVFFCHFLSRTVPWRFFGLNIQGETRKSFCRCIQNNLYDEQFNLNLVRMCVSMGKLVNPFASHAKDPRFEPEWRHFFLTLA